MSYEAYEESVEGGQSVELFVLTLGSTIWRMHNSIEDEISYSGDTYYKTNVGRERIVSGQDNLAVEIPADHTFPLAHVTSAPGQVATLTIYSFHRGDTADVRVLYKGVVRAVSFTKNAYGAKLNVMPITQAFDKMIPDRTFQAACNHVLYDTACTVSSSSYQYTGAVSAVTANVITVTGLLASKGAEWATAGYVSYGILDFRLVLGQASDDCTLILPFYEEVSGQNVDVYAGCDHTIGTCDTKFSNEINFGGTPYVPTRNIFISGLD
ncbi:MAG: hypothetical protein GY934_05090 [Gammaproteobacteria bacterium]|nr:hypothetical protein [Gammaproteobacteria bacterium]